MDEVNEKARLYYERALQRSRDQWNKKKQERIANGTYRGRGRPRKYPDPPYPPALVPAEVAVASEGV